MTVRQPVCVLGVGSFANRVLRSMLDLLLAVFPGGIPPCYQFRSVDSTAQGPHNHPFLPQESFLNIGQPRTSETIKRIAEFPDLAWYPRDRREALMSGRGAGGQACNALLMLRDSIPEAIAFLMSALLPFSPAQLPKLASVCNRDPQLLGKEIQLAASGGVDVYAIGTTVGGTSGILLDMLAILHQVARQCEILSLNVIPILVGPTDTAQRSLNSQNKYVATFRTLDEFKNHFDNPEYRWMAQRTEVKYDGRVAPAMFVVEAGTMDLAAITQDIAMLLANLAVEPTGKVMSDLMVDDEEGVFSQTGPHGQRKTLATIGQATLYACPPNHAQFGAAILADLFFQQELDMAANSDGADELADGEFQHEDGLRRRQPCVAVRDLPAQASAATAERYVAHQIREMQKEAAESATAAKASLKTDVMRWDERFDHDLPLQIRRDGPLPVLRSIRQARDRLQRTGRWAELEKSRYQAAEQEARMTAGQTTGRERLAAQHNRFAAEANREFFDEAAGQIQIADRRLALWQARLESLAADIKDRSKVHQRTLDRLTSAPSPTHIVLTHHDIRRRLLSGLGETTRRGREAIAEAVQSQRPAREIVVTLESLLAEQAAVLLEGCDDIDSALDQVGPANLEQLIEETWQAAGSATRIDPTYPQQEMQWRTIANVADGSLASTILRRQPGDSTVAPSTTRNRLIITRLKNGLEPTALELAHDARDAFDKYSAEHIRNPRPPWSRKGYRPGQLVAPARQHFYRCLTLPVAQIYGGSLRRDPGRGWLFQNNGHAIELGATHVEAFNRLFGKSAQRHTALPSADEISRETEERLQELAGQDPKKLVRVLHSLAERLKQMRDDQDYAGERILLDDALFAAQSIRDEVMENLRRYERDTRYRFDEGDGS